MPTPPVHTPAERTRPTRGGARRKGRETRARRRRSPRTAAAPRDTGGACTSSPSPRRLSSSVGLARSSGTTISSTEDREHEPRARPRVAQRALRSRASRWRDLSNGGRRREGGTTRRKESPRGAVQPSRPHVRHLERSRRAAKTARPTLLPRSRRRARSRCRDCQISLISSGHNLTKKSTTMTTISMVTQVNAASLTRSRPRPHGTSRADRHGAAHYRGVFQSRPPRGKRSGTRRTRRTRRDFR